MNAKILRSQKGFTLIELMIVVGIIGILVAIAAPNFSRYQSKARQSEAKIALAAIYSAEKSFFSEYSAYIASLDAVGYAPEGLKRYYLTGFATANTTNVNGYGGVYTGQPNFPRLNFPPAWTNCTPALTNMQTTDVGTTTAQADNPGGFIAGASGQIREGNTTCDMWTINHNKTLSNSVVAL